MSDFTTSATLKLVDKSTANINKVNKSLQALLKTANSMKKTDIGLSAKNLGQAQSAVRTLNRELKALQRVRPITIRANTSQATAQIQRLRQQASRPITTRLGATGGVARGGAGGLTTGGTVKAIIAASSINTLAFAIGRAVKEGIQQTDVADTSLALKQLSPEQYSATQSAINQIQTQQEQTPSGSLYNRAQTQHLFSEALGVTRGNVDAARDLTSELILMTKQNVALGQSFEQARSGAIDYAKAAESMGALTDSETGNYDPRKAKRYFEFLRKVQPDIGEEFSGPFVRQAVKYLRGSKYGMTEESLAKVLFLNEESGSNASVGYNQALKQLSGTRIQEKQLDNLIKFGLIKPGQVKKGELGGQTLTQLIGVEAVDADLQSADLAQWIDKHFIPAMIKQGYNPNSPLDAQKFANLVTSDRTATETLAALIIRNQELNQQVANSLKRDARGETIEKILADSSTLSFQGMSNQFTGMMGETINALEPVWKPLVDDLKKELSASATRMKIASKDEGMTGVVKELITGPTGKAVGVMGILGGLKDLATATDPLTKAAASLQIGASTLLLAASEIAGYFGGSTSDKDDATWTAKMVEEYGKYAASRNEDAVKQATESQKRIDAETDRIGQMMRLEREDAARRQKLNEPMREKDALGGGAMGGPQSRLEQWLANPLTFAGLHDALEMASLNSGTNIATAMTNAGPGVGTSIVTQMQSGAPSVGTMIGDAALARIQSAKVDVNVRYAAADIPASPVGSDTP